MIRKVAEVFVMRRQFGITGIVTREEMSRDIACETVAIPAPPEHPEIAASSEEIIDVPAAHNNTGAAVPPPETKKNPARLSEVPSATDFWRAVRAAVARSGEEAEAYVHGRSGGETNLRRLAPDTAVRIYREALAAIQANGADPTGSTGAAAVQPTSKTNGKARDHAEFWVLDSERIFSTMPSGSPMKGESVSDPLS